MSQRYIPRKANASLAEGLLPEAYAQYAIRTPNEIRVEADIKARALRAKEKAIAPPTVKPVKKLKRAITASDKTVRTDRLQGAIDFLTDPKSDGPKGRLRATMLGLKDSFGNQIHSTEGEPNLLGAFADEQKLAEENPEQYALDTQVYMPSTRTGFYKFIKDTYADRFTIPSTPIEIDPKACEKLLQSGEQGVTAFLYQEFIKEYLRQASPYRGLLVYHGLGSGKTCSAIAAAESLYGIANKKIIVMTPQSLRNNFIKEISFCGFRHYSLNNYWTPYPLTTLPKAARDIIQSGKRVELVRDPLLMMYALSVMSLKYEYLSKLIGRAESAYNDASIGNNGDIKPLNSIPAGSNAYIWIPDYSKKPNFNELTPIEKDMVRFQIAETIRNRFEFISYNGIGHDKLKALACDPRHPFDNAVIVIDEIHNLIRLMQGDIEPFLFVRPGTGKNRKIEPEQVEVGHWKPKLCDIDELKYTRGYLFYRLLVGAKNSKIIGLSGTPIINVPEEIGIMANILAGYIDTVKINVGTGNSELASILEEIANRDLRVDYVKRFIGTASQTVMISIFNEGYIKVLEPVLGQKQPEFKGVIHSTKPEAQASIADVYKRITETFLTNKRVLAILGDLMIAPNKLLLPAEYKAYARLPPDMENFRNQFIDVKKLDIRTDNEIVLKKRLTGIVSYYRRARPEFFPEMGVNEIVRCALSDHALGVYSIEREAEIDKESKKKDKDPVGELYSVVEKFSKGKSPSSYRFASRAACNYAFPGVISKDLVINRPYPSDAKEYAKEVAPVKDSGTEATPVFVPEVVPEKELSKEERELIIKTRGDGKTNVPATYDGLTELEQEIVQQWRLGADAREQEAAVEAVNKEDEATRTTVAGEEEAGIGATGQAGGMPKATVSTTKATDIPVATPYQALLRDAMFKLNEYRKTLFALNDETNGLKKYSCKLYKILKKMEESKGPTLVYSQYKTVEGLGVLSIALRTNGYDQITFKKDLKPWQPIEFDEASIASFKKGPGTKRFITFSGEEDQRQRSAILAIYNGQWQQLTRSIRAFFTPEVSGFDGNLDQSKFVKGEIIACIGITGAGAEGISLRNVRQVHIMEPFWNMARLEQVKGRAIRVCSHADLPIKERIVDIYTYVSVFSEEQIKTGKVSTTIMRKDTVDDVPITSDQTVLEVATRKQAISNQLLKVLQEVSVDCQMNNADNYLDQEPLECFNYRVTNQAKDPYMFEPDLEADKISTKSKLQPTKSNGKTGLKVLAFPYKDKEYIAGPWQRNSNGEDYAMFYSSSEIKSGKPIRDWKPLGTVDKGASSTGGIGSVSFYNSNPLGEEEVEVGEEEEAEEETEAEAEAEEETEKGGPSS